MICAKKVLLTKKVTKVKDKQSEHHRISNHRLKLQVKNLPTLINKYYKAKLYCIILIS